MSERLELPFGDQFDQTTPELRDEVMILNDESQVVFGRIDKITTTKFAGRFYYIKSDQGILYQRASRTEINVLVQNTTELLENA